MDENLVGYLLNALDPETSRDVESHLRQDPEARRRLDLLRQGLQPLALDRDAIEPPPGLADRTLARVVELRRDLPHAPPASAERFGGGERSWWRRADVLVAACLLIALLGLGVSWVAHVRQGVYQIDRCQNNLRVLHQAVMGYADRHNGDLPWVEDRPPRDVAGIFIPLLHDAGVLGPAESVICPAEWAARSGARPLADLEALPPDEFRRSIDRLAGAYAYSLGYRDPDGRLFGLRRDPAAPDSDLLPVLADRPPVENVAFANSPSHRNGQNVLYLGGHVRFCTARNVGVDGDDIYLNQRNQVAAGLHRQDTVLGASADHP
jgi:hypothetical protein